MFSSESSYVKECRSEGVPKALAYYADINQHTRLHGIGECARPRQEHEPSRKERLEQQKLARPRLCGMRTLTDSTTSRND